MFKNLLSLIVGLTMIIFVKKAGNFWIKAQHFFTKREYPMHSFVVPWIIVGIIFIITGLIGLFEHMR